MTPPKKITEFTRTDIVDALLLDKEHSFNGKLDLISFLKRAWPLESMPSQDSRFKDAAGDIWQHMVNNYYWDESELLYKRLGINEVPDEQLVRFLETCMSPIVAKHYAEKVWPTHERRSAFEKAIESKEEYILPARFDDTEIPGLHKHIVYVDLRRKTQDELVSLIMQKLGREMISCTNKRAFRYEIQALALGIRVR